MSRRPTILAMDLEGVLTPEIWIAFAEHTGVEKLRLTTRDIADYDVLMRGRLDLLHEHGYRLRDIQDVIAAMPLLEGAGDFLNRVRLENCLEPIILSGTFYEFQDHFMRSLGWPALFCNTLRIDDEGFIADYCIRIPDGKRKAVQAFSQLNFDVIAVGDSYNDTAMLAEADLGLLFRPSESVRAEFPQFPVATEYAELEAHIAAFLDGCR